MKRRWPNLFLFGLLFVGAAVALWYWGAREPVFEGKTVSEWLVDLDERQPYKVRSRAEDVLKRVGAKAVPAIVRSLEQHDSSLSGAIADVVDDPLQYATAEQHKERALAAIEILGPAASNAMPTLISLFQSGEMPSAIGRAMAGIDPVNAVKPLTQALSCTNIGVRRAAVWRLSDIASNAEPAIPQLVTALQDSVLEVRRGAARALGHIHKRPQIVVPALAAGLADTNWEFQRNVLIGLQEFGAEAKPAIPAIERCLADTNASHRAVAAVALWYVDPPSAARAGYSTTQILNMLQAQDENARRTGFSILWLLQDKLQDDASAVLSAVIPFLGDTNSSVRSFAATLVGDYGQGQEVALTALVSHLDDPDPVFRRHVTNLIVRLAPRYFVQTNR